MKKLILLISHFITGTIFSQLGINTASPDASSILDIVGLNGKQGVLLPRVNLSSTTDAVTIPFPANGLTIFNINGLIGEGIYINEGSPASPTWKKMKLLPSGDLSKIVSTLAYPGTTNNSSQILDTDTFQWRLISNGTTYSLQMRLKNLPTLNITTTPTFSLNWKNAIQETTPIASFTWATTNWDIWQTVHTYQIDFQSLFYFGVLGTEKLFRVNLFTNPDSYNYLMVEQF